VVALESTLISHGLPYPQNLEVASASEAAVRETTGAVPATVAVRDGHVLVGLDRAALEALATAPKGSVRKAARPSLAVALAEGGWAATTVSATMIAAAAAGITVFATGGIGGVHRGAEKSFDISADLDELARTPVIVVSAGAKAILDIEKTLEVLETRGVPVVAYRSAIANFFKTRQALGLSGGLLVANPIEARDEIGFDEMAVHIAAAQKAAEAEGVSGKAVTPYLLGKLVELTKGASLKTNIALVENNARLAARIAREL